ncbi:MAG: ClpXP protease specificity-enhancing factor [Pseudomonadota bacterium]
MVSNQPYLLRAFYDWIVDSACTPHVLVDATLTGVSVPQEHVQDGQIVLNISPMSVEALNLGNEWITFFARFSGQRTYIEVPVHSIRGIYAKENGEGASFQTSFDAEVDNSYVTSPSSPSDKDDSRKPRKKPTLTVVK